MMPRLLRNAVRVALLSAASVALGMLLAPTATTESPYVSALSHLGASPIYAKGCPDKICNRNVSCVSGLGYSCRKIGNSGCEATPCN